MLSAWNIRGLNKSFKQKELKDFLLRNNVDVVGCLETKIQTHNADRIKKSFGKDWAIFTDSPTTVNGRVWLFLRGNKVKVTILDTVAQLVHCRVEDVETDFKSNVTFVCGFNIIVERLSLCSHLKSLDRKCNDPPIILGDLNVVLSLTDRENEDHVTP